MLNYLPCPVFASVDETSSEDFAANYQPKTDLLKAAAILVVAGTGALTINHSWVAENQDYMGILLGLGVLWILTDAIHYDESERQRLKVPQALSRIDIQGALFFLGILLSVSSLEARELANYLDANIPIVELIASSIGVVSAVISNVPLVAATMGMWIHVAHQDGEGRILLVPAECIFCKTTIIYEAGIAAYLAVHHLPVSLPTTLAHVPFLSGS